MINPNATQKGVDEAVPPVTATKDGLEVAPSLPRGNSPVVRFSDNYVEVIKGLKLIFQVNLLIWIFRSTNGQPRKRKAKRTFLLRVFLHGSLSPTRISAITMFVRFWDNHNQCISSGLQFTENAHCT